MMFVVHARRLQPSLTRTGTGPAEASLEFFMNIEPFVASSFLFVAGYSLVLSRRRATEPRAWFRRMLRRAAGLYAISVGLFVLQYGVDLPDLLLSSGILSVIAVAIVVIAAALRGPNAALPLVGVSVLTLGVTAALESTRSAVSGLNAGPGGAFPLLAHAALGALAAEWVIRHGRRAPWIVAAATLPLTAAAIALDARWTGEFVSHYRALDGRVAVLSLFDPAFATAPREAITFWNHSTWGALALVMPLFASLALALEVPQRAADVRPLAPALLVGRHALLAYVAHLCVLGLLDVSGLAPPGSVATWLLIIGLCALSVIIAWAVERWPLRRPPARAALAERSS